MDRWIEAAKRLAAKDRPPVKKASEVSLQALQAMVDKVVTPFIQEPDKINALDFRVVVAVVITYYTFCRFADYRELKAKHVEEVGEDILITFPKAKNDQFHEGRSTILKANGSNFCPVRIIQAYFTRFGLSYGPEAGDNTPLFCMMRRNGGTHYAQQRVGSSSLAMEDFHRLQRKVGQNTKGVTFKSVKMVGVTKMREAGATWQEVAQQGRWKSKSMPLRFQFNSLDFKRKIAGKVPYQ